MANDIALVQPMSYLPTQVEMNVIMALSGELGKTPYYQKLGVGGCLAVILSAREMGVPTMYALNGGLVPVNGRVTMSAQLMNAVIIRAGHQTRVLHLDDFYCEIEFKRYDRDYVEIYRYSIEDAEKAKLLGKDNWKHYRRDMLYCRCLSGGARKYMPDAIFGCYVHGEIESKDVVEVQPEVPTSINEIKSLTPTLTPEQYVEELDKLSVEWSIDKLELNQWLFETMEVAKSTATAVLERINKNKDKALENFNLWNQRQQNALQLGQENEPKI